MGTDARQWNQRRLGWRDSLSQDRVCRGQQLLVIVVRQVAEEPPDPVERLAQEKVRGSVTARGGLTISSHALQVRSPIG